MGFGAASAALGVVALWPRPTLTVDMDEIRTGIFADERTEAVTRTADTKFVNSQAVFKQLERTAQRVRVGFLLLIAAIACAIAHAVGLEVTAESFVG
jgi:hypothetical protein